MRVKAVSIAVVLSLLLTVIAVAAPLWQVVQASATEVRYDDGMPAGFVDTPSQPYSNFQGVKFSLPSQMRPASILTGVHFYCNSGLQEATLKVHITAGDPTVELVAPITYSPSRVGWHTVSVPVIDITGDFWVIVERGSNAPSIGMAYDTRDDSGRSYVGKQLSLLQPFTTGDLLIRAMLGGDSTPPTTPVVVDDGDYTNDNTQLHGSWSSSDDESGIAEYQYAIGITQGGTDVVGWTSAGTATEATCTGLSLSVGTKYYFAVKAKNGAGIWSTVGTSDGITNLIKATTQQSVSSQGGTVQTTDVQIATTFPANAITDNTTVTINQRSSSFLALAPQGFKVGNTCFTVEAVDANGNAIGTFSQPVTITVKYSDEDVAAAGGDPTKLALAYYDEAAAEWKMLDTTVNTADKTLSATTTHFSTWAILAKSPSEGLASWIWIVIGIAAAAGVGIMACFVRRRLTQKA